jgi:chromosome segregation ATPase
MDNKNKSKNISKLMDLMKPLTKVQLVSLARNLNKELKIPNVSTLKRQDLETEMIMRADIIINLIDKDKKLALFENKSKKRVKTITQKQYDDANSRINKLTKLMKRTRDRREIDSYMKEINELNKFISDSVVASESKKQEVVKNNDQEINNILGQIIKLNEEKLKLSSNESLDDINEMLEKLNDEKIEMLNEDKPNTKKLNELNKKIETLKKKQLDVMLKGKDNLTRINEINKEVEKLTKLKNKLM